MGESPGEPSRGRFHALSLHHHRYPSPPDDALGVAPRGLDRSRGVATHAGQLRTDAALVPRTHRDGRAASAGRSAVHLHDPLIQPSEDGVAQAPTGRVGRTLSLDALTRESPSRRTIITLGLQSGEARSARPAHGEVSKLVDEHDLGSCAARRPGSSPGLPTRSGRFVVLAPNLIDVNLHCCSKALFESSEVC